MSLAFDLHAAHVGRRQRMADAAVDVVSHIQHQRALDEARRLRELLRDVRSRLIASQQAEHHARGEVASLSRALREANARTAAAVEDGKSLPQVVLQEVAGKHGCTRADLRSPRRVFIEARQEAFYRLATECSMSLPRIGALMNRDHTTVLHGIRVHARRNGLPNPYPCKADRSARGEA